MLTVYLILVVVVIFGSCEDFTFRLTQSTGSLRFWTTTPSKKVLSNDQIPTLTGSQVSVYCAKNEIEPFIVGLNPTGLEVLEVTVPVFGSGITVEFFEIKYITLDSKSDAWGCDGSCEYPDILWPREDSDSIQFNANKNTFLFFNVHVPTTTSSGDYGATLTIGSTDIPINVHVFNFALPKEQNLNTDIIFNYNTVLDKYSVPGGPGDTEYGMKPENMMFPNGFEYPEVEYDCSKGMFTDGATTPSFEDEVDTYLTSGVIDGKTFPTFMFDKTGPFTTPDEDFRPSTFCSVSKESSTDWLESLPFESGSYNQKWFSYLNHTQMYFESLGILDKCYYYAFNELNSSFSADEDQHDAIAWYSSVIKQVYAPDLKLLASSPPEKNVYANELYPGGKIDIWNTRLQFFNPSESFSRLEYCGEETWIYFDDTNPPYLNPIIIDHPGIEGKLLGWMMWRYRVNGFHHYSANQYWNSINPFTTPMDNLHQTNGRNFLMYPPDMNNGNIPYGSNNHRFVTSLRLELLRDGIEDWEYLYLLNDHIKPNATHQQTDVDHITSKLIYSETMYSRDDEYIYSLRKLIGEVLGGEGPTMNDLLTFDLPTLEHPRAKQPPLSYYVNFQDPEGEPYDNPLVVNDRTWEKIGWNEYNSTLGYGWLEPLDHVLYSYDGSSPNSLQASIIYDDYGWLNEFQYVLPNGCYDVTVSIGWYGRSGTYPHNKVVINGVIFFDDESNSDPSGLVERMKEVCVLDNNLDMKIGVSAQLTMLNYLMIEPVQKDEEFCPNFVPVAYNFPPINDFGCNVTNANYTIHYEVSNCSVIANITNPSRHNGDDHSGNNDDDDVVEDDVGSRILVDRNVSIIVTVCCFVFLVFGSIV